MAKREFNLNYIIFITIAAAIGGFLFGYDTAVVSGTNEAVWHYFDITMDSFAAGFFVSAAIIGSPSLPFPLPKDGFWGKHRQW